MSENETTPIVDSTIKGFTVDDMIETFDNLFNGSGETIANTGFEKLDDIIGGYIKGELVVIGSRPGMGNSSFLLNQLLSITEKQNVAAAFYSLQLSKEMILERLVSIKCKINFNLFKIQQLNEKQQSEIREALLEIKKAPLFFYDSSDCMINDLYNQMLNDIKVNGVKLFFIDYLQLINSIRKRGTMREEELSYILRKLKKVAKDNDSCVVITSTLSRSVETRGGDKRPMLSDLRESGSIEQMADKVFFIYRSEYYNITEDEKGKSLIGKTEIMVAKNNRGPLANVILNFNLEHGVFSSEIDLDKINFKNFGDNPFKRFMDDDLEDIHDPF
jgi:replicative DNA helicase